MAKNSNAEHPSNVYQSAPTANCTGSSTLKILAIIHQHTVYPKAKKA